MLIKDQVYKSKLMEESMKGMDSSKPKKGTIDQVPGLAGMLSKLK